MRTETIEKTIDQLNKGDTSNIFLEKISNSVEYGFVWIITNQIHPTRGEYQIEDSYKFYFIKDVDKYVGAVHLMDFDTDDLHWFIKKESRKKGLLTTALNKYILPHILQNKECQRITINARQIGDDNYSSSKKVALSTGFEKISEDEFLLNKKNLKSKEIIKSEKYGITKERVYELSHKLKKMALQIRRIEDEFSIKTGELEELKNIREKIEKYGKYKLEDEYWKFKK